MFTGPGAAARLAAECGAGTVLNGIVGAAGLAASLAALGRGARLALANKETLVVGGPLVRAALARGGELVPVDSEHSAALQCLGGRPPQRGPAPDAHRLGRGAARAPRLAPRDAGGGAGAPGVEHGAAHHGGLGHARSTRGSS